MALCRSAKPPSPVQIRTAPPILNSVHYHLRVSRGRAQQPIWEHLGTTPVRPPRSRDGATRPRVRTDVQRGRHTRMSELLLGDLHGHLQSVEQRRVDVAELMPRHASKTRGCGRDRASSLCFGRLKSPFEDPTPAPPERAGDGQPAHGGTRLSRPVWRRKKSGYGPREQGTYAKEFYTVVKTAYVAP